MKYWILALLLLVPTIGNATDTFVVKQKVVEFAHPLGVSVIGVPVSNLGLRYYYEIKTEDNLSDEDIDRISNRILEQLENNEAPTTDEETVEPVTPEPVTPTGPVTGDADLKQKIEQISITKCGNCHKVNSDSGFEIIRDGHLNPELTKLDWWNIWDHVDGSHLPKEKIMPKNGDPLSQEDVDAFRLYVRSLKGV